MNWSEIRRHYLSGCLQANAAANEALLHLTEGQRTISAKLDLEDTETIDASVATVVGQDYVAKPAGIYRVIHVFELSSGQELEPEHAGIRGRANYLVQDTGMPAPGPPKYYVVSGGKIWLRPTPDLSTYTIRIRGKAQMPEITEADYGVEPSIPDQYHMAIAWAAMLSFFASHPEVAKQVGPESVAAISQQMNDRMVVQELPKERERFDARGRMSLRGFRVRM